MTYTAIVLAAGKGSRTGLDYNKMFFKPDGKETVLETTLKNFLNDPDCTQILVTTTLQEEQTVKKIIDNKKVDTVYGGETRQDSVYNALVKTTEPTVFIHDGARPFLKEKDLQALKEAMETEQAALLMVPATDTTKLVKDGYVRTTLERKNVWQAQTPQAFRTDLVLHCHENAKKENVQATDDAQLVELYSETPVKVVQGDSTNTKITLPKDVNLDHC